MWVVTEGVFPLLEYLCYRIGGYYPNILSLGLFAITWIFIFTNIIWVFENHQGYTHASSQGYYWLLRSLCFSVHSLSFPVWIVTLWYKLMVIWPVCPPCCLKGFSPTIGHQIQSPCVGSIEWTLDYSDPTLDCSKPIFDNEPVGILLIFMSWWSSVNNGWLLAHLYW
jgi:hypothetical protein